MVGDAPARFFVDENDLALGRSLALAGKDVLHPGHRRLPAVPLGTQDAGWLPIVGAQGLVVITRDKTIRSRPVEAELVVAAGIRGFVLTSAGDLGPQRDTSTRLLISGYQTPSSTSVRIRVRAR